MNLYGKIISTVEKVYFKTPYSQHEFLLDTEQGILPIRFRTGEFEPDRNDHVSVKVKLESTKWQQRYFINLIAVEMEVFERPACVDKQFVWEEEQYASERARNDKKESPF